jgi:hypothetical protein
MTEIQPNGGYLHQIASDTGLAGHPGSGFVGKSLGLREHCINDSVDQFKAYADFFVIINV